MTRRHTLILLSTLSLSAIFNLALAWWPRSPVPQAIAMAVSGPARSIAGQKPRRRLDRPVGHARTNEKKESSQPAIIGLAEASVFPLTPTDKISPEEIEVLGKLRSVKEKLDARSMALDVRQHAIEKSEAGMKKEIARLEAVLARAQDMIQQQQKLKNKKIKRLAAVYDSMKPAKAAPIISRMDLSTVIRMFAQMDKRKVGKILSFLPPEKAVHISQRIVRLNAGS